MINYIIQELQSIGFNSNEISSLFTIIYNSIEQSKNIESQIANTRNYKFIEAYSLIDDYDWYSIVKVGKLGNSTDSIGIFDSNGFQILDSAGFIILDSTE